jgi:hypothetical protein
MALKIYEYEKWFSNFKQKMLKVGTIKCSNFNVWWKIWTKQQQMHTTPKQVGVLSNFV